MKCSFCPFRTVSSIVSIPYPIRINNPFQVLRDHCILWSPLVGSSLFFVAHSDLIQGFTTLDVNPTISLQPVPIFITLHPTSSLIVFIPYPTHNNNSHFKSCLTRQLQPLGSISWASLLFMTHSDLIYKSPANIWAYLVLLLLLNWPHRESS